MRYQANATKMKAINIDSYFCKGMTKISKFSLLGCLIQHFRGFEHCLQVHGHLDPAFLSLPSSSILTSHTLSTLYKCACNTSV